MNFKGLLLTIISCLLCTVLLFSQVPDAINYQAVARDGSGNILSSQGISVRMGVYDGGGGANKAYEETHAVSTNQFGLFSLQIGNGTTTFGTFSGIDWAGKENHLQVEVDAGAGYVNMGKTQFVAAPYALHAKTAENVNWIQNGSNIGYTGGKVGIGTTSPTTASLEINGTGSYGAGIELKNGTSRFAVTNTGNNLRFVKMDGSTFTAMNIASSGNIGIGTTAPTALLQITAAAGVDPLRVQLAGLTRLMVHDNGGVGLGFSTTTPPSNGMIVAGEVGIGIATPSNALLHIHESSSLSSNIRFTNTTTASTASDGCWVGINNSERMYVWNYENTDLILGTNNATRLHIESTGLVGINDAAPSATFHIKQYASGEEGLAIENDGDTDVWAFEIGGNDMNVSFNGSTKAFIQDTDGSWNTFSDRRMKKDIRNIERPVLSGILKLNPVNYLMKDVEEGERTIGFIAQDVKKHFPELVNTTEDGFYYLNYDNFGVYAIKAIQEQQEQIDALQKQVEELMKLLKE